MRQAGDQAALYRVIRSDEHDRHGCGNLLGRLRGQAVGDNQRCSVPDQIGRKLGQTSQFVVGVPLDNPDIVVLDKARLLEPFAEGLGDVPERSGRGAAQEPDDRRGGLRRNRMRPDEVRPRRSRE